MELAISRDLLDEIRAHAADQPDREVCGLLLGRDGQVLEVRRCRNVAENPARRFEIDPAALIGAWRDARLGKPGPIGHYHSHPSGRAIPSACDADMADPGSFWLIVAGADIGCWWSVDGGEVENMFAPVSMR